MESHPGGPRGCVASSSCRAGGALRDDWRCFLSAPPGCKQRSRVADTTRWYPHHLSPLSYMHCFLCQQPPSISSLGHSPPKQHPRAHSANRAELSGQRTNGQTCAGGSHCHSPPVGRAVGRSMNWRPGAPPSPARGASSRASMQGACQRRPSSPRSQSGHVRPLTISGRRPLGRAVLASQSPEKTIASTAPGPLHLKSNRWTTPGP